MLSSIEEQGKLTEELKAQILAAQTQVAVDDLYRPYRPKRRTRATIAKEKGLEPLANTLMEQKLSVSALEEAAGYINDDKEVKTAEDALAGAADIIAEAISDTADYRTRIRDLTMEKAVLHPQQKIRKQNLYMRCIMNLTRHCRRLQDTEPLP